MNQNYCRNFKILIILSPVLLLLGACKSSNDKPKFGNPLIEANIRYLKASGELTGTWSFFQRNQVDSLVPDAQLHEFIINGQKVTSDKVKNNYHMYMVYDTLISQNLNVQIRPSNRVISISMPEIPPVEADRLQAGLDWTFSWDTTGYEMGDTIIMVLTDSIAQTAMSRAGALAGQVTLPYSRTGDLEAGKGFYYIISKAWRRKKTSGTDLEYNIEVYSRDFPVEIVSVED